MALGRSYWLAPTPLARAQIQYILMALVIGLVALILGPIMEIVTDGEWQVLPNAIAIAAWALFPLAAGVAVLRYRLFDIRVVLRATLVYSLLTVAVIGEFFLILFGISHAAVWAAGPDAAASPVVAAIAAVTVATLAHPLQVWMQKLLDRLIYQNRVARARFREAAHEQLGHAQPPEAVASFLTEQATQHLDLTGAWLVLPADVTAKGTGQPKFYAPSARWLTTTDLEQGASALLERLREITAPVALATGMEQESSPVPVLSADDPVLAPWHAAGARVIVPLRIEAPSGQEPATGRPEVGAVWVVGHRRRDDLFARDDLAVLSSVGRQAAVVLDYARLYRQQVQQELVQHELARAREIQQGLLPAVLPGWPGLLELAARFRPALETSGDFYDVIALDSPDGDGAGPLQIAVGDVAGKGLPAALVMAEALTTLRATTHRATAAASQVTPSPATTMEFASSILHQYSGPADFVACSLALIEPPGVNGNDHAWPRLHLSNAAQVPPLLSRDGRVVELQPPGERLPLGVLPHPAYEEVLVDLQPGDVVVFASDGLPEAPAAAKDASDRPGQTVAAPGELFGFERLATATGHWADNGNDADAVAAGLWAELNSWCGEGSQHDDMTLVVLRVPTAEQPKAESAA